MRKFFKGIILLEIICILLCAFMGIAAFAQDEKYEIRLGGKTAAIFQIDKAMHGYSEGSLPHELLKMTTVEIKSNAQIYYNGKADAIPSPVTEPIVLDVGESIEIEVSFYFSEEADNRFQGVSYQVLWEFATGPDDGESENAENVKIHLPDTEYLYSNLNINPGDTYGFSILVKNEEPLLPKPSPSIEPSPSVEASPSVKPSPSVEPSPSAEPSHSAKPEPSEEPDDGYEADSSAETRPSDYPKPSQKPTDPGENPDDPKETDNSDGVDNEDPPHGGADGDNGDSPGINTGDYSEYITEDAAIPLLVTSGVFLVCIIGVFICLILEEKRKRVKK